MSIDTPRLAWALLAIADGQAEARMRVARAEASAIEVVAGTLGGLGELLDATA